MPAFYCILLSKHKLFIKLSSCHAIIRLTNVTQVSSTGTPGYILVNRYTRIKPEKIRKEVTEFYFVSWEDGMLKKSLGKLMSVATNIFLIRQTVFLSQIFRKLFCS